MKVKRAIMDEVEAIIEEDIATIMKDVTKFITNHKYSVIIARGLAIMNEIVGKRISHMLTFLKKNKGKII